MKRATNLFFHELRELKRNRKLQYKIRFIFFSVFFLFLLVIGCFSLVKSFASYSSRANLSLDIQTAMFVVEEGETSFNIDLNQIIPSDDAYIYTFSISNFDEEKRTDVDLSYQLKIQTTTNMPLAYRLYYQSYNLDEKDIISSKETKQDSDGSWYHLFTIDDTYEFTYQENQTNIYYLVVDFPSAYKNNVEYSDSLDNIEVIIDAKQTI